jgi:alpha-amylase
MKKFSVFEIGSHNPYFDDVMNKQILERIAYKSYLPTNRMLLNLIKNTGGKFKVSLSITGVLLEQLEKDFPDVLKSFQDLVASGACELVAETYYHSLASMYSPDEFTSQVQMQKDKFIELFSFEPRVFRNTELMYTNALAKTVEEMGFTGILAEGWDKVLGWRSPNFVYKASGADIALLMRNYRLSDDISFRFSNREWKQWPLTAEKYVDWVNQTNIGNAAQTINLFMDYETFGEHQWEETGIFNFFDAFVRMALEHPQNRFTTLSGLIQSYEPVDSVDVPYPLSWADTERDLSAWLGNKMQQSAIEKIYSLEGAVKESGDGALTEDWRKLQTSDHFYYMCTKWFSDGDVHKYFNPYESPYESFISFMNIFNDIQIRAQKSVAKKRSVALGPKLNFNKDASKGRKKITTSGAKNRKKAN